MFFHKNIKLGSAPALFVFKGELENAAKKGSILFFHGLTGSKETQLLELEDLARSGFLAVGIDAIGHGERGYPDINQRFAEDNPDAYNEFLKVVVTTAHEVPTILDSMIRMRLLNQEKIGIAGISLGGGTSCTPLLRWKQDFMLLQRF